jgi:hypothetical protein
MFQRAVNWLIGNRRCAPAAAEERRVWIRHPCEVVATCQLVNTAPVGERLAARVQDISRGGINLVVNRRFDPNTLLSVELPGPTHHSPSTVLAYVVRVAPRPAGEWSIGCTFATELSDEELRPAGAQRLKALPPDQRAWVRFPGQVRAVYQRVNHPESDDRPAQVLDISANGIGLLAADPLEVGTLLSVVLRGPDGKGVLTMLACVVRSAARNESEWALGCNFIRELTDQELRGLL